jgi:hypothetical protein
MKRIFKFLFGCKVLPQVLASTNLAQKFLHLQDVSQILHALKGELENADDTQWQKFWVDFAGMLTYYMADGKLSVGEAIALAQAWYHREPAK